MRACPRSLARSLAAVPLAAAATLPHAPLAKPTFEPHDPRLLVDAPSEAVVGEPAAYSILLQDEWGREGPWVPTAGTVRAMRLEVLCSDPAATLDARVLLEREDHGHRRLQVTFGTPGLHTLTVDGDAGIAGRSNPVRVLARPPAERVYWGDLHGHLHTPGAGHTGAMDLDEYGRIYAEGLAFARDASRLDFAAFTEHIQGLGGLARADSTGRTPWDVALREVEMANAPGTFVVFPGFEWQGDEGDHCVIYPEAGPLEAPAEYADLVASVRARGALLTAHAVYLPDTFVDAPDELAAIEVTRDSRSMEWLGKDALAKGVVRPWIGGSDTHGGALGATSLTGLRAASLDRESILRAIREGRTWATNGERIVLEFTVEGAGDLPRVAVRGLGTAPVDRIEIDRNGVPVAEARGFPESPEFAFTWEDEDLLRVEAVAGPVAYHASVVQTSANRYDPAERDLAIAGPVLREITPRQFDAVHERRGGQRNAAPGAALELVRDAWGRLRAEPGRPLAAAPAPGKALPPWTAADLAGLRTAVHAFERLAVRDTSLRSLATSLSALPEVAVAVGQLAQAQARLDDARATGGPTPARIAALRADVEKARLAVEGAESRLRAADRDGLARVWFAPRVLETARARLDSTLADFATQAPQARPVVRGVAAPVTSVEIPVDPRIAAEVHAVEARESELQALHDRAWGYTAPSRPPGSGEPALRVRVVAEGRPEGARLVGGGIDAGGSVPFRASTNGWVAVLDRRQVPVAGEPPLEVRLASPATVSYVFLEGAGGAPLHEWGRVTDCDVMRDPDVTRVRVHVDGGDVAVEVSADGSVLFTGNLDPGEHTLAFPAAALADPATLLVRWGFAGWRRVAGVEVPGHDVARPLGFGALADGRAAIALTDGLVLVDPVGGKLSRRLYPDGVRLDPGRQFCAAPCAQGTVIRGASSEGSWALLLDASGEWSPLEPGPEHGTVASGTAGGIAWLVGQELYRRDAAGQALAPHRVDAAGRLLAIDASGRAIVRAPSGETVRVDGNDGRILEHLPVPLLGVDGSGAALVLSRLDRRHAELATGAWVSRYPGDGSHSMPFSWAIKASPAMDPPLQCAAAPGGGLLVLGGTVGWRRGPENDWFGVEVERWESAWVGEARARP